MARYEDYVQKRDGVGQELEDEITSAQENHAARLEDDGFAMPDKFANKSPEEIAQSYVQLEKTYSQQGNDLGQMRRTVDQLIALQSQPAEPTIPEEPLTVDDLWDNPEVAIQRSVSPQLNDMEKEIATLKSALIEQQLTNQYPEWEQTTSDAQFQGWVQEKPYRQRLAVAASQNDLEAATELLDMYGDSTAPKQNVTNRADLANASLERGSVASSATSSGNETFSRYELMNKRIASKQGDDQAERWLHANSEAIAKAYKEGRVVD